MTLERLRFLTSRIDHLNDKANELVARVDLTPTDVAAVLADVSFALAEISRELLKRAVETAAELNGHY